MTKLAYFDNGNSFRRVLDSYVAQSGEVVFPDDPPPTTQQLQASFPNYGQPTDAEIFQSKLDAGCTIQSTAFPDIVGTYAYDSDTQTDLAGIAASIGLSGINGGTPTFPDGTTQNFQYPQLGGQSVTTFATVTSFQKFYFAYAKLLQSLRTQQKIMAAGGTPQWPPQTVTVT